jgi:hypothetical protein
VIDKTAEALNAIVLPIDATAQDMVCSFADQFPRISASNRRTVSR